MTVAMRIDQKAGNVLPISADSHVVEPPHCYIDYIDPRYRDRAPRIGVTDAGSAAFFVDGFAKPIDLSKTAAAGVDSIDLGKPRKLEELPVGGWDAKARLADQDRDGIAAEVVYPSVGMLLCNHPDADLKNACMWAYNRWLQDFVSDAPDRIYGLGQIAITSIDQAVNDVFRLKDMGFKGIMMPGEPDIDEDFDDPVFDRLWAAAAEAQMPLSWHVLTGGQTKNYIPQPGTPSDPRAARRAGIRGKAGNMLFDTVRMCQDILTMLVWSGAFERNPGLKVVCAEADAGWVPHYVSRMDHSYERHRHWKGQGDMAMLPSEIFAEHIYLTFQDDQSAFQVSHLMNAERLMWANDFPHSDSTWPHSQAVIAELSAGVSEETKVRILRDNVAELYGI